MSGEYSAFQRDIIDRLDRQDEIARQYREDSIDRLARIEEHTILSVAGHKDHEARIRSLEKKIWIVSGVAASIYPILSVLGIHLPTVSR